MRLKPCCDCPHRDGCTIKASVRVALKTIEIRNLDFTCDKRLSELPPGRRVRIALYDAWSKNRTTMSSGVITRMAIVMRPIGKQVMVWVEDGKALGRHTVAVAPDRLTPTGEDVEVCAKCGQPDGTEPATNDKGEPQYCCSVCMEEPEY